MRFRRRERAARLRQESHGAGLLPHEGLGLRVHQAVVVERPAHGGAGNVERARDVRGGDDAGAPGCPAVSLTSGSPG